MSDQLKPQTEKDQRVVVGRDSIKLRAEGRPLQQTLPAKNVVYLAVDCSVSMAGEKLDYAKRGAVGFARQAREKEYAIGIVSFGNAAIHICDPQADVSVLRRYLVGLSAEGSTNMAAAIHLATQKLLGQQGARRALVLATDGMPDDRVKALEEARRARAAGIDILTLGTDDADKEFLALLASRSDLSSVVPRQQLAEGITNIAKLLPEGRR